MEQQTVSLGWGQIVGIVAGVSAFLGMIMLFFQVRNEFKKARKESDLESEKKYNIMFYKREVIDKTIKRIDNDIITKITDLVNNIKNSFDSFEKRMKEFSDREYVRKEAMVGCDKDIGFLKSQMQDVFRLYNEHIKDHAKRTNNKGP